MAILVPAEDHCLLDLLWRWRRGDLPADIPLVASSHRVCEPDAERFGVPFAHVPVPRGARAAAEAELLEELARHDVDVVVLARYMQILSVGFLEQLDRPVTEVGRDIERRVLGRAVRWHLDDRVLVYDGRTVVF